MLLCALVLFSAKFFAFLTLLANRRLELFCQLQSIQFVWRSLGANFRQRLQVHLEEPGFLIYLEQVVCLSTKVSSLISRGAARVIILGPAG